MDAGIINHTLRGKVEPVKSRAEEHKEYGTPTDYKTTQKLIWPELPNGKLAHGGFLIKKGEKYRVSRDIEFKLSYFDYPKKEK